MKHGTVILITPYKYNKKQSRRRMYDKRGVGYNVIYKYIWFF